MLAVIKKYFGYYYLLFFFSFLSMYYAPMLTPFLNGFILVFSYFLIIKRQRFDVIIMLILYCRCMNGFIFMHHKSVYTLINILTNVVPILLYFSSYLYLKRTPFNTDLLKKHRFTLLFFLFLSLSFLVNFSTSYDLITKRYLPFFFFLLFLVFFEWPKNFQVYSLIRFFRATFFASILLYFLPSYLDKTRLIMESDSVFSVAMSPNSYSLVYFDFVRNMGFIFDHRILAIFAYLFLMLCLVYKPKYYQFDILLSLLIVTTSTSRGGMITYAFIIAAYLFQVYKHKLTLVIGVFMALVVALVIFVNTTSSLPISGFIKSFNPASKDNAINQRGFFADYATKAFLESPIIGNGVGSLSSHLIERDLILEGHKVPAVGDAYWYVLLAEMGAVGFILYLLFLLEVFYSAGILNIALLVGFAIQLIGTDIPDMRFYYFVILVLVYTINRQLKLNITKNLKLRHEN